MKSNVLLAVALAAVGSDAAALSPPLIERAACNRDNLFRCFIDQRYSVSASQFCANLLPSTVTVATITATETTTVQTELTADIVTSIETFTTTVFTETIATATTTVTFDPDVLAKRQASASPPKCMTNGVTYPASRITSACSCIDVPVSSVSVTYVAGTETVTETNTVFTTPSAATITTWETVSTAAAEIRTVTVAPMGTTNRLSFQDGTMNGWELLPETWLGQMKKVTMSNGATEWSFNFVPKDNSLATLRYLPLVYMEAGRYQAGFTSYGLAFPAPRAPWGRYFVFDIANPSKGTNITVTLPTDSPPKVLNQRIVMNVQSAFDIPESAAGYNQITLRWIATPQHPLSALGNLAVQKTG
ncbi:hypothetical protein N0V84_000727 [Fusarium piperis]|uniref:Uncharacterized protein n=1 Tax=Fusarium piperis TaxID=1435070 RepID=A0A9W9BTM6_9HYPO|nr:hypothetical protein N0V84_000727 [Fusarium piperis]